VRCGGVRRGAAGVRRTAAARRPIGARPRLVRLRVRSRARVTARATATARQGRRRRWLGRWWQRGWRWRRRRWLPLARLPLGAREGPSGSARRAEWDLGGSEWEVGQHRVGSASGTLPRPSRPRGGRLDPEWRPLRSGDEPPGQTPQAESPTRAPASNATTARQPRPLPRDLSEVVPGEMSPQKWQVVGHGRGDRGEVPTGPLLRAVDLPTSQKK